jgi:Fur family iron response transcriptional regulator
MLQDRSFAPVIERLRSAGLRPTRQRLALARLLFGQGDRHLSAEELHAEAVAHKVPVSLATVYNTLNQFTEAGLLREVVVEHGPTSIPTRRTITISSMKAMACCATSRANRWC